MRLQQAVSILEGKLPIEDIQVKRRIDRAYDILRMPGYEITPQDNDTWLVDKLSSSLTDDTSVQYTVTDDSCTCPDFTTARAGLCKHRLAVQLLQIMAEE